MAYYFGVAIQEKLGVPSPDIAQPRSLRFAWGDGDAPNLMASNDLPAAQFRAELK